MIKPELDGGEGWSDWIAAWERFAAASLSRRDHQGPSDAARGAALDADALMAERLKRIKAIE